MKYAMKLLTLLLSLLVLIGCFAGCAEDGKSAYEIAVDNGFVGTEQEWLASLKGEGINVQSLYEAAVAEGYTGTLFEYLTECLQVDGDALLTILREQFSVDTANYIGNALLSSVSIVASFKEGVSSTGSSNGSGVIYQLDRLKGDAYIITNHHVVTHEGAVSEDISVFLYGCEYGNRGIEATYIGGSSRYDIAVLQIKGSSVLRASKAEAVTILNRETIPAGTTAIAIGNSVGKGISVTSGVVSVDSEIIVIDFSSTSGTSTSQFRVMRIDAPVNEGNSGGGIFNRDGALIGIVSAKKKETGVENIAYAIPLSIALGVADNIIDNCDGDITTAPLIPTIGATLQASDSYAYYDEKSGTVKIREQVVISEVHAGSLASRRGLRQGDVLVSFSINGNNPVSITRTFTLIDALLTCRVGDIISITYTRGGLYKTITFTLTEDLFSERA